MSTLIDQWMHDPKVKKINDEAGNIYSIRIIGRGEHLFFRENNDALICEIDAVHKAIFSKSISKWHIKGKMDEDEKKRVIGLIEQYYKNHIDEQVVLV